jgi:hypothetical protein
MTDRRIGIDFDNTLALYDLAFRKYGVQRRLLPADFSGDKNAARATIRSGAGGEAAWTALQADVYGPGMAYAEIAPGAAETLGRIRAAGSRIFVVSHKTVHAAADPDGVNLREAAWRWLEESGLLRGPIDRADVFFESTRAEKIARIARLGCHMFLDDLEEVFHDPAFPADIERHLLVLDPTRDCEGPFRVARSWREFFDHSGLFALGTEADVAGYR